MVAGPLRTTRNTFPLLITTRYLITRANHPRTTLYHWCSLYAIRRRRRLLLCTIECTRNRTKFLYRSLINRRLLRVHLGWTRGRIFTESSKYIMRDFKRFGHISGNFCVFWRDFKQFFRVIFNDFKRIDFDNSRAFFNDFELFSVILSSVSTDSCVFVSLNSFFFLSQFVSGS